MATARPHHIDGGPFLAYPNRNSVPFREAYGIPEAHAGRSGASLRYEGNTVLVKALLDQGWLDTGRKDWLKKGLTWAEIQQRAAGASSSSDADLIERGLPALFFLGGGGGGYSCLRPPLDGPLSRIKSR